MKPADVLRRMPASIREVRSARGDEPYHLYVRDGDRWVDKGSMQARPHRGSPHRVLGAEEAVDGPHARPSSTGPAR